MGFGVKSYPTAIVVGHDGRVVWRSPALSEEQDLQTSRKVGYAIDRARKAVAASVEGK
jgi:hypothetical protein